jgi:uncharacterized membrane protein YbhN (UPF0104 family)
MAGKHGSSAEAAAVTAEGRGVRLLAGAAGWIAAVSICAFLWRRTPVDALRAAVAGADPALLATATAFGLLSEIVISSAKSRRILWLLGAEISLWETIVLRMGAYPARQLMPFKSGELVRMVYLKRRYGLSLGRASLLPLLDAATNAAVVAAFVAVGFALSVGVGVMRDGGVMAVSSLRLSIVVTLVAVLVVSLAAWRPALRAWRRRFGDGPSAGPARIDTMRHATGIAAWTVALVTLELVNYALVLRAFNIHLPPSATLLLVSVAMFAAGLPTTPMGLGVREAALTTLLAPYGEAAQLLAAGATCSAVMRLGPTLVAVGFVRPFVRRMLAVRRVSDP